MPEPFYHCGRVADIPARICSQFRDTYFEVADDDGRVGTNFSLSMALPDESISSLYIFCEMIQEEVKTVWYVPIGKSKVEEANHRTIVLLVRLNRLCACRRLF